MRKPAKPTAIPATAPIPKPSSFPEGMLLTIGVGMFADGVLGELFGEGLVGVFAEGVLGMFGVATGEGDGPSSGL
jgi:hypothetical protein